MGSKNPENEGSVSYSSTLSRQKAGIILLLLGLCIASFKPLLAANPLDVVINEVAWMGTQASSADEWIELYNNTGSQIDIGNWSIYGADTGECLNFSDADGSTTTIVPAHGYLIYANHEDDVKSSDITNIVDIWDATISMVNDSPGQLILYDAPNCEGNVIDTANQAAGDWFAGIPSERKTMERKDATASGTDGSNWTTNDGVDRNGLDANDDPINGTPKAQNSPFNKPPSCNDINVTTDEDTSKDFDLALHCNDPDGDPLTGSFLSDPPNGTAQFLSPTVCYTPDENFSGSDSFTFRVSDSELESNTATVSVTVSEVNDNPVADAGPDQTANVGDTVQLDGSGSSDPDGDPLSYNWTFISEPPESAATISDPAIVNPTFVVDVVGDYILELTVDDGRGGTDSDQVTISAMAKGDVNDDTQINMQDAILAAKFALGLLTPTEWQRKAADVVPPCGAIDARDVVRIAEVALEIEEENIFTCNGGSRAGLGMAIQAGAQSSGKTQLHIADKEILPGERATIHVSSSSTLGGVQVGPEGSLSFDPAVIRIKAIRRIPPFQVLASEIDNQAGRAKFTAIALAEPQDGEIIEIEVEAVGQEGESTLIRLNPDMTLDAEGNDLQAQAVQVRLAIGTAVPLRVDRVLSKPNPVRNGDRVRFTAEGQGINDIQVQIYDLSGREVFASGWVAGQTFEWNLISNRGRIVANGIYLYIVTIRGFSESKPVRSSAKKLGALR